MSGLFSALELSGCPHLDVLRIPRSSPRLPSQLPDYIEIENFPIFDFDGLQQSSQSSLQAYIYFNTRTSFGIPSLVVPVCKPERERPYHPDDPFGFARALRVAPREGELVDPNQGFNMSE